MSKAKSSAKRCLFCKKNPPSSPSAKYCSPECRGDATKSPRLRSSNLKPSRKAQAAAKKKKEAMSHNVLSSGDKIDNDDLPRAVKTLSAPHPLPAPYDAAAALAAFKDQGLDKVEFISTGIPELDAIVQIPRGRVTQIAGPWGVGKTTLCLNMIAGLRGQRMLYIDTEMSLNPQLLVNLRIRPQTFKFWNKSAFIEDVYDVILKAATQDKFDVIVFDSLAACTFRTEAEGEPSAANMGQKAKIMNKLMRILPAELKKSGTALVIINQERDTMTLYGPKTYTPGGTGKDYAASLVISLRSLKSSRFPKTGPPFAGHEVTATVEKSKVSDPYLKAIFKIYYGGRHAHGDS